MAQRKRSKAPEKPVKKRLATSSRLPPDTTQVVAEIVHTLDEKKFGTKLVKKNNSRTKPGSQT